MTQNLVKALRSPACYPHATGDIRVVETHISWVLLTGEIAYKIRKPVNFGFLDFSTLAGRRFFCDEELRLNSRFSTWLYLEVVAICGTEDAPYIETASATGTNANVLEYAVKMREFDQRCLLANLASTRAVGVEAMEALGKKLADFHNNHAARLQADNHKLGTVQSITSAVLENFKQILPLLSQEQSRRELEVLRLWTVQQLAALHRLFTTRHDGGFVRECHGDLHLGNIVIINGEMTFFDCIEFNPQFRWIDIQSELAFVLMDLEAKQLPVLGNHLLNCWLEFSGDYQGVALLQFYKVYRALVRAKVTVLKIQSAALAGAAATSAWQEYATYAALARSCCNERIPFLAIMHGVSGTGKSTVASALAAECNGIRIRSDVERKRLFGIAPDARARPDQLAELYSEAASDQTFAVLEQLADSLLTSGYPVFVDATFIACKLRRRFQRLAEAHGVPFVIIDCQASPATILRRLQQRQTQLHSASDADIRVMTDQLSKLEPFSIDEQQHVLPIDTEQPLNASSLWKYLYQQGVLDYEGCNALANPASVSP